MSGLIARRSIRRPLMIPAAFTLLALAMTAIRSGGQGAYVGAVVFPLLAILFGWSAWRLLRLKN